MSSDFYFVSYFNNCKIFFLIFFNKTILVIVYYLFSIPRFIGLRCKFEIDKFFFCFKGENCMWSLINIMMK